jgi:hypothetical protein
MRILKAKPQTQGNRTIDGLAKCEENFAYMEIIHFADLGTMP